MESKYATADNSEFCNNITYDPERGGQIINICKMCVYFYNASLVQNGTKDKLKSSNYPEFMNYLINFKLTAATCGETEKKSFYDQVTSEYNVFKDDDVLKSKMYVINDKYLINLNILYKLYENYDKLIQKGQEYYSIFLEELKSQYNYALGKCFYDVDIKYCGALEKFKSYYEASKSDVSQYCANQSCPALPELILSSQFHNEPLRTSKLGNELIWTSYAQYLRGYSVDTSEKYYNLKNLISLQYNLRMEKDDYEKYCVMMKILLEFFQYCKKNKRNPHLFSFIKEFIEVYYKKKKNVYDKIFADCASNNSKSYCEQYKKCNQEFEEEISLIRSGPEKYINNKEEYFKNLAPDDSWIGKAIAIFQDSAAMSKNSPTIMSTLVSIILIVFFLYKLTPLSSIFRKEKKKRKIPFFFPERIMQEVNDENIDRRKVKHKEGKIRFAYQPS